MKIQKIKKLIERGFQIKVTIIFRGRAIIHQELGMEILKSVTSNIADKAKLIQTPILKGKQLSIALASNKKKDSNG